MLTDSLRCRRATAIAATFRPALRPRAARRSAQPLAAWPSARADWRRLPPRPRSPGARSAAGKQAPDAQLRANDARRRCAGRAPPGSLDDAILERMEGHDHQPPARRKQSFGPGQGGGQLGKLVVDEDAERLERAGSRMNHARPRPHHALNNGGKRAGWCGSAPWRARPRWRGRRRARGAPRRARR